LLFNGTQVRRLVRVRGCQPCAYGQFPRSDPISRTESVLRSRLLVYIVAMVAAPLSDLDMSIGELAQVLDRSGFVCVENVVSPGWLEDARESVKSSLLKYGENDFCIIHPNKQTDTPAHRFVSDPAVRSIMEGLALARCPQGISAQEEIYSVLRVLAGPEREASSYAFHYDAAVVTMLVPLFIPAVGPGRSGELVVFPNRRPFRSSVMINMLEKVSMQNRHYRKRIMRELNSAPDKYTVLLKPGNIYLFWGYRTFHGNLPCAPNAVRATLLLHYGNPHGGSPALAAVKKVRRLLAPTSGHTEATVVRL
jgi:hypothetical protein